MGVKVSTVNFEWTLGEFPKIEISADSFSIGSKNMAWNYRVVKLPKDKEIEFSDDSFTLREVFYDDDGKIEFWSDEGCMPFGNNFQEIADDFDLMAEAFQLPVLMVTEDEDGKETLVEIEVEYEYPEEDEEEEEEE